MLWLTEPQRPFASAFKQAQRIHEKHGCTYYLLGWTEDEVLYYRSACDGRLWAFDPATDHAPYVVSGHPPAVAGSSVVGVNADGVGGYYPAHPAGFPRRPSTTLSPTSGRSRRRGAGWRRRSRTTTGRETSWSCPAHPPGHRLTQRSPGYGMIGFHSHSDHVQGGNR